MPKLFLGAIAGAVAMFITGFIFFATPLYKIAYGSANEVQQAAVQNALAANLPATGTYMIPSPDTAATTVMYGKGPIAQVRYNSGGFSVASSAVLIAGFIHELIVAFLIAGALYGIAGRVTGFGERVALLLLLSAAALGLGLLSDPIWTHVDWAYSIYSFVGSLAMLMAGGVVIIRWFLPKPAPASAEQTKEANG